MKVTVCFGNVRVIVPCGSGEFPVKDLIEKAITRYKKATGKPLDYWVAVHNLKTDRDGGILDPDDMLNDVADDKEQIIADFDEQGTPVVPPNGGDGTSASSAGTASPDMFHSSAGQHRMVNGHQYTEQEKVENQKNDVVITEDDLVTGSSLIVRRGSEPVLNTITSIPPSSRDSNLPKLNKRWSAVTALDVITPKESDTEEDLPPDTPHHRQGGNGQEHSGTGGFYRFARDSARQSLASNSSSMYRWLEAQERQENKFNQGSLRREPVGGSDDHPNYHSLPQNTKEDVEKDKNMNLISQLIVLKDLGGPLGIHVVPDQQAGRDMGLILQRIEEGSRVHEDGQLKVNDHIVEINETSLVDVEFKKAQEIFKNALQSQELRLRVIRPSQTMDDSVFKQPPPVLPKPPSKPPPLSLPKQSPSSPRKTSSPHDKPDTSPDGQSMPNSPMKKIPPAVPARHPTTSLSTHNKLIGPSNTRKIGKKLHISLEKGVDGLGFSVTTRDNPAGGNCPIYIKNIMSKGAAIVDGQLKSGDRLLEVNGMEMTGKSQAEAVAILRNMPLGATVDLVVSRQITDPNVVPRELNNKAPVLQPAEKSGDDGTLTSSQNKQTLVFDIALNGSESAGLGVSVKGSTAKDGAVVRDLGIFIKSVIHGGAASKDGRLKVNDRLIEVNGTTLTGMSNIEAMNALRDAMQKDTAKPGYMNIKIARRVEPPTTPTSPEGREVRISLSEAPESPRTTKVSHTTEPEIDQTVRSAYEDMNTRAELEAQHVSYKAKNPMIDRLLGGSSIRNLSYQKATQDLTLDESGTNSRGVSPEPSVDTEDLLDSARAASTPIHAVKRADKPSTEEDEVKLRLNGPAKPRPASTLGFSRPEMQSTSSAGSQLSRSKEDLASMAPEPPQWLTDWDKNQDVTFDTTNHSEMEGEAAFQRDGFGRQSMSEKRRGHMDPTTSELYNKIKQNKEHPEDQPQHYDSGQHLVAPGAAKLNLKRIGSAESVLSNTNDKTTLHGIMKRSTEPKDVGPNLGLRKSSSLESLQTAVQDLGTEEEEKGNYWNPPNCGVVRGRGCNESFRAAVDRSYDNAPALSMDPVEEESGSGSQRSSFSEEDQKKKRSKSKKEKSGLFKGLGNMFRFGKHRKSQEDQKLSHSQSTGDIRGHSTEAEIIRQKQEEIERYKARRAATDEQERIHEQYRKLREREQTEQEQCEGHVSAEVSQANIEKPVKVKHDPHSHPDLVGTAASEEKDRAGMTRNERIQQLRQEHQRRHMERKGRYPLDEEEERYEQQLRKFEQQNKDQYAIPPKRRQSDPHGRERQDPYRDPEHYSHYKNLSEIQANLQKHDQYQQKYKEHMSQQERNDGQANSRVPGLHDPQGQRLVEQAADGRRDRETDPHRRPDYPSDRRQYQADPYHNQDQLADRRRSQSHEPDPRRGEQRPEPEARREPRYDRGPSADREQRRGYDHRRPLDSDHRMPYNDTRRNHSNDFDPQREMYDSRGYPYRHSDRRMHNHDVRVPRDQPLDSYQNSRSNSTASYDSAVWQYHLGQNAYRSRSVTPQIEDRPPPYPTRSHTPINHPAYSTRPQPNGVPRHVSSSAFEPSRGYNEYSDPRYRNQRGYSNSSLPEQREWHRNGNIPGTAPV